jgi:hypothetical protein
VNAPSVSKAPWLRFKTPPTPKTSVNPMATTAYSELRINALIRMLVKPISYRTSTPS